MSRKRVKDDGRDEEEKAAEEERLRSKLRRDYREDIRALVAERQELVRGDKKSRARTEAHRDKQEELFKSVTQARELVLDTEAAATLSRVVAEQAQNVDVALSSDTPAEFCARVKAWMARQAPAGGDSENPEAAPWRALGRTASLFYPYAPGATFVYGAVPTVPKPVKARKPRAAEDKVEKLKKVDELDEEVDPELHSLATIEQVNKLSSALKTAGKYPVWKMVVNPKSMAQTVEHLFHLSFLVKDNRAQIVHDEKNGTMTMPAKEGAETQERVQAIVRLDKQQFDAAIAHYKISQPMLEHREASVAKAAPVAVAAAAASDGKKGSAARAAAPITPGSAVAPTQLLDSSGSRTTTPVAGKKKQRK